MDLGTKFLACPSVKWKACFSGSQKSAIVKRCGVYEQVGSRHTSTHSKRDHSADAKIISSKGNTRKVCCLHSPAILVKSGGTLGLFLTI